MIILKGDAVKNFGVKVIAVLLTMVCFPNLANASIPIAEGLGHVKYYGFYGQGYLTNSLISGSANFGFIHYTEIDQADRNAEMGIASVVQIESIFFSDDAGHHVPLRSDSQARWEALISQLEPRINNGKIIGFYLYGEPYSNRAALGLSKSQTYNELRQASLIIKNSFRTAKVMVVEQYAYLEPTIIDGSGLKLFPAEIDWIGFDCYMDTFDTCGGKGIPFYYNQLKSGLHTGQKIFLVPQITAYAITPTLADQNYLINLNKQYLQLAQSSPDVIGLVGWIAANYYEPSNPTRFWGGLEPNWGTLENYNLRDSLLENGRILLGWQQNSIAADLLRVQDKVNIINALQSYYKAHGSWPVSTSGVWNCLAPYTVTCWQNNSRGSDSLVTDLMPYLPVLPQPNAVSGKYAASGPYPSVPGNYGYNSYIYASDLPANNLGNNNPRGAYLVWPQENSITGSNCNKIVHPDKYWYCYELIQAPTTAVPVTGDLNNDCIVNTLDWSLMNSKWYTNDVMTDINHDGIVNTLDWGIMNANWFKKCT